jgi:hypothetical protein
LWRYALGTKTDLLAYDVDENRDHFFKDVPDGVNGRGLSLAYNNRPRVYV